MKRKKTMFFKFFYNYLKTISVDFEDIKGVKEKNIEIFLLKPLNIDKKDNYSYLLDLIRDAYERSLKIILKYNKGSEYVERKVIPSAVLYDDFSLFLGFLDNENELEHLCLIK